LRRCELFARRTGVTRKPRVHNIGTVEGIAVLVYAIDVIPNTDVEVLVAVRGGVVIAFRGDNDQFAVYITDKLGDFFTVGNVSEADSTITGTGKNLPPVRASNLKFISHHLN